MNMMKFRKVGQPSSDTVSVKIAQSRRAIYPLTNAFGKARTSVGLSRAVIVKHMLCQGYVPANGGL